MENILINKYLPYLADEGIIKSIDIDRIPKEAKMRKEDITTYILKEKIVEDIHIEEFLANVIGVQVIDPLTISIRDEVIALIDKDIAKKYKIIPVSFEGQVLSIATSNPMDIVILDDLRAIVGFGIKAIYSLPYKIEEAYYKVYKIEKVNSESDVDIEDIIAEATSEELEVIESETDSEIIDLLQSAEETPVLR